MSGFFRGKIFPSLPERKVVTPAPKPIEAPVKQMPGDSVFQKALLYTYENEGGFSNVKEDKGGPTKYGITIHDLSRWRKKELTADDVRNMTREEAEKIYLAWYWRPLHLDRIEDERVAMALYDRAVLNGLTGVSRHVRVVCGEAEKGMGDTPHFDPLIPEVNATNPIAFVMRLADRCDAKHASHIAADPSQKRFEKGWKNRVNKMRRVQWGRGPRGITTQVLRARLVRVLRLSKL
jgi:lysozyme family protein